MESEIETPSTLFITEIPSLATPPLHEACDGGGTPYLVGQVECLSLKHVIKGKVPMSCECNFCTRDLPSELFRELNGVKSCPICTLELVNRLHNRPLGTRFEDDGYDAAYRKAIEICRTTDQKVPYWAVL